MRTAWTRLESDAMRNRHSSHPHKYVPLRGGGGGIILAGLTRAPVGSIYSHGFLRIPACTPRVAVADAARNLAQTLELANEAPASGAVLAVVPELGLCSYAARCRRACARRSCSREERTRLDARHRRAGSRRREALQTARQRAGLDDHCRRVRSGSCSVTGHDCRPARTLQNTQGSYGCATAS